MFVLRGELKVKHLVFIVGSYYPNFSAVGSCVNNVVNSIKDKCKVTVICCISKDKQKLKLKHEGYNIIRIAPKYTEKRLKAEDNINNFTGIKNKINKAILMSLRGEKYLSAICSKSNIEKDIAEEYLKALREINEPIDAIIPACIPFEGVLAAVEYGKENKTKVIPYFFDPFADNTALHRTKKNLEKKLKNHLELEEYIIKNSQNVILMEHMKKHFFENFSKYKEKFIVMEHPTLINNKLRVEKDDSDAINITYAGAFNKGVREPDYLLKLISNCNNAIKLNVFSVGNCEEIIGEYASKENSNIIAHGGVDKSKATEALLKADVLVNVGNVVSNQTPSKIFEYIAMGKPLIHLYYNDTDAVNKILKKYPCALCIKQEEENIDKNIEKIIDFCKTNSELKIPFEEIKKIYPEALPETTGELILKLVD